MFDNFLRVAAATPKIRVADPEYNLTQILSQVDEAYKKGAKLIVLPELTLSGYTCADLFLQSSLLMRSSTILQVTSSGTRRPWSM